MEEKQNKSAGRKVDVQRMAQELNKFVISFAICEALADVTLEQLIEITKILNL